MTDIDKLKTAGCTFCIYLDNSECPKDHTKSCIDQSLFEPRFDNESNQYIEDYNLGSKLIKSSIDLYTDGACSGNPGRGGIGYVIRYHIDDNTIEEEGNFGYKFTTNNRMEMLAVIIGLDKIFNKIKSKDIKNIDHINVTTDSRYVCDAINQNWILKWRHNGWTTSGKYPKPVKNVDLWCNIIYYIENLSSFGTKVIFNHIPGHKGHKYNEICDKLATSAIRNNKLFNDEGYKGKQ